jgi:hypothetical protein
MAKPLSWPPGVTDWLCVLRAAASSTKLLQRYLPEYSRKTGLHPGSSPQRCLTIGQISHLQTAPAEIVCLSYLEFASSSPRFAVRRLRQHLPKANILGGFWRSSPSRLRELGDETKADFCAAAFKDALDYCLEELRRRDDRAG